MRRSARRSLQCAASPVLCLVFAGAFCSLARSVAFGQDKSNSSPVPTKQEIEQKLTGTLTLVQPRRYVKQAPPSCSNAWQKIESGDALTTARLPEQGLDVCRAALEASCRPEQREGAQLCIAGAIAERNNIDYIHSLSFGESTSTWRATGATMHETSASSLRANYRDGSHPDKLLRCASSS